MLERGALGSLNTEQISQSLRRHTYYTQEQQDSDGTDANANEVESDSYHSSHNQFGSSVPMIEFCIKTQIYSKEFSLRRPPQAIEEETVLCFNLYIGGQLSRTWFSMDDDYGADVNIE